MAKRGLYANIHAKKKRIAAGSGEKMRKPGAKGAPTAANFKRAAKIKRAFRSDNAYSMMKKGGKAKKKSKFPDHSGDGKITKKDVLMAKGVIPKKKQGYKDRKDESIAMRIRKKRTKKQLKDSRDESYGKYGSIAKKSGKINR